MPTPMAISTEASEIANLFACMPAPEGSRCPAFVAEVERELFGYVVTQPDRIVQIGLVSAVFAPSSSAMAPSSSI